MFIFSGRRKIMKHYKRSFSAPMLFIAFLFLLGSQSAHSVIITYEAQDLTDTTVGEDLWQYTYNVSDHSFTADTGFSIYFDYNLYSDLQDPTPFVNGDWDILTFQPDNLLPDDGIYDAYALADSASLADPFTVSFLWLGGNTPTSQSFELYDSSFNVIESGFTNSIITSVPEPSSFLLIGLGLLGILYPIYTSSKKNMKLNALT